MQIKVDFKRCESFLVCGAVVRKAGQLGWHRGGGRSRGKVEIIAPN